MKNTLIFLRHAETVRDKNKPVSQWLLAEAGKKAAEKIAASGVFDDVEMIISSDEKKTYQTATPIAERLGKRIIRKPELNELNRDKAGMLTKGEYDQTVVKIFEDLDYTVNGWETTRHALKRFKHAIKKIDEQYDNKKILIVTHGLVMSLYFADLQDKKREIYSIWKSLAFCAWGIVINDKVVKNIV